MKIGEPVKTIPDTPGNYVAVYAAIDQLPNGDYLPVSFDTPKEAHRFYLAARASRQPQYEASKRKCTVYIRKKAVSA